MKRSKQVAARSKRTTAVKGKVDRIRPVTAWSIASGAKTKVAIQDVAERLFAEKGFDGASMREIGQEAKVPLALVSYHFKSKLGLYQAVFRRRLEEVKAIRVAQIQDVPNLPDRAQIVRTITRILVEPIVQLEASPVGRNIGRLIAREGNDPREDERGIIEENFDPIAQSVIKKLKEAFPEVDPRTIYWAYLFASGALSVNHAATGRIERLSSGLCRSSDSSNILENLVEFISGGILAAFGADTRTSSRKPVQKSSAEVPRLGTHS